MTPGQGPDETRIDRLVRTRRRTVALIVTAGAELVVRAPQRMPLEEIERFVHAKRAWIRRKQEEARASPPPPPRRFAAGEVFFHLGRAVPLEFVADADAPVSLGPTLRLRERERPRARESLERWYRQEAERVVMERCRHLARKAGYAPLSVSIGGARRRWGSCSPHGRLRFSWRLVQAPAEIVEYVVAHELAHLRHPHHRPSFWREVGRLLPDYRERRRRLRKGNRQFV